MSTHSTNIVVPGLLRAGNAFSHLRTMLALRRQRRDLARLDDSALKDIGISRYEAEIESRRPVWDVPQHWLR